MKEKITADNMPNYIKVECSTKHRQKEISLNIVTNTDMTKNIYFLDELKTTVLYYGVRSRRADVMNKM